MRLEERRVIRWGLVAGGIAGLIPLLYLSFLFVWGMRVAGPLPVPETRRPPAFLGDAIWARAEGGKATELRPINPLTVAQLVTCLLQAEGQNDNERMKECREVLPALRGVEYLAALHLKDQGITRASFRGGAGSFATLLRLTRSWTRADFVNTMAARADFGFGWRGADAAALGFFGHPAGELTLPEAAMIASRLAALEVDPWCDLKSAVARRDITLRQMHENGAIDQASLEDALGQPLKLAAPPSDHQPCGS